MSCDQEKPPNSFMDLMGMPVFLRITVGEDPASLFCTIIGEANDTVRIRIADQWDVDVFKDMVCAVDAFPHASMDLATQSSEGLPQPARPRHRTAAAGARPGAGGVDR